MNVILISYCRFQIKIYCNFKEISSLHYIKYHCDSVLCCFPQVLMCREQYCPVHAMDFQKMNILLSLCARTVVCPGAKLYAHNMSHSGD